LEFLESPRRSYGRDIDDRLSEISTKQPKFSKIQERNMKVFLKLVVVSFVVSLMLIITTFFVRVSPVASQTQRITSLSPQDQLLVSSQTMITFTPVATLYLPVVLRSPGLSGTPTPTATPTATSIPTIAEVKIIKIEYDPVGIDAEGEYVEIKNLGQTAADLTDWTLRDAAITVFAFPAFTLNGQATVRVWVKSGVNTATDLYWGRGGAVWNNTGDTAILQNNAGTEIHRCTYPEGGPGFFDCVN
jgi:hypothetical protein